MVVVGFMSETFTGRMMLVAIGTEVSIVATGTVTVINGFGTPSGRLGAGGA